MNVSTSPNLTPEPALVSDDKESDEEETTPHRNTPRKVRFPFDEDHGLRRVPDESAHSTETMRKDQLELLKLHNKYGHISFKILRNCWRSIIRKKLVY